MVPLNELQLEALDIIQSTLGYPVNSHPAGTLRGRALATRHHPNFLHGPLAKAKAKQKKKQQAQAMTPKGGRGANETSSSSGSRSTAFSSRASVTWTTIKTPTTSVRSNKRKTQSSAASSDKKKKPRTTYNSGGNGIGTNKENTTLRRNTISSTGSTRSRSFSTGSRTQPPRDARDVLVLASSYSKQQHDELQSSRPRRKCKQCGKHSDKCDGAKTIKGGSSNCNYKCSECDYGPLLCECQTLLELAPPVLGRARRKCKQCGQHSDQCIGAMTMKGGSDNCIFKCDTCDTGPLHCTCPPLLKKKKPSSKSKNKKRRMRHCKACGKSSNHCNGAKGGYVGGAHNCEWK